MIGNKEKMHDGPAVRKECKSRELWQLKLEPAGVQVYQ